MIVDAKVPLAAYLDSCEATDDAERARHLESHARQVREHVAKLSAKSYWQQFGDTPDYVVMFLPDEGFFRAAWEQDPSLVRDGRSLTRPCRLADHAHRPSAVDRVRLAAGERRRGCT